MFNVNDILNSAFNNATNEEIITMLDRYKLNWKVGTQPLSLPCGTPTNFWGITRLDTKETFGTCKEGYQVFQNEQLAELVIRIGEKTGYEVHKGGKLRNGAHVFLQLKTSEVNGIGENKDRIVNFATSLNSHDGKLSLAWGHTNRTISCKNDFNKVYRELKNKARHTKSLQSVIDESLRDIDHVKEIEKSVIEKYFQFAETPATTAKVVEVIKEVTTVDISLTAKEQKEKYSTYALNRMSELVQAIASEQRQKGATMWGLFSGVTKYTSHIVSVPKRENAREESKMIGSGKLIDNKIFDLISA